MFSPHERACTFTSVEHGALTLVKYCGEITGPDLSSVAQTVVLGVVQAKVLLYTTRLLSFVISMAGSKGGGGAGVRTPTPEKSQKYRVS